MEDVSGATPEQATWERSLLDWLTEHPPPTRDDSDTETTGIARQGVLLIEYVSPDNAREFAHMIRLNTTSWAVEGLLRWGIRCVTSEDDRE